MLCGVQRNRKGQVASDKFESTVLTVPVLLLARVLFSNLSTLLYEAKAVEANLK